MISRFPALAHLLLNQSHEEFETFVVPDKSGANTKVSAKRGLLPGESPSGARFVMEQRH
jgi:hypothetical protein